MNKYETIPESTPGMLNAMVPDDQFFAVTPSDTVKLQRKSRALFVGNGGTIACVNADGQSVSFTVADGFILPVQTSMVKATGTTATGIVAL